MNVDPLTSSPTVPPTLLAAQVRSAGAPTAAQLAADRQELATTSSSTLQKGKAPTAADIKKAASQFEAIILRQLLAPSINPLMSGGIGGSSQSEGGGVYGYMLTDVMADNMAKGGGLGIAKLLEKQFSQAHPGADKNTSDSTNLSNVLSKS